MPSYQLRLYLPAVIHPGNLQSTFYWTPQGRSSFSPFLGPSLGRLGPVKTQNKEFARIAAAVFAADRSTLRKGGGSNWNQRTIQLSIPVTDVAAWQSVAEPLSRLLDFLSGDTWSLSFYHSSSPRESVAPRHQSATRVVLLSGGADSAIGALLSRTQLDPEQSHSLVSHVGFTNLAPFQDHVADEILHLIPGPGQLHIPIQFHRMSEQPNGTKFAHSEPSSRTRSLLFLALGLAVASLDGVPLWIPENGFASLNPPLGPERRGSLSTRTTHPYFLKELSRILTMVGAQAEIVNPLADKTKGELFEMVVDLIGNDLASHFLSSTHSCGLTYQRFLGLPSSQQCGVCFGCVVRRASFASSGVRDRTVYVDSTTSVEVAKWLASKSIVPSVRDFVKRGVRSADIQSLNIPDAYSLTDGFDLCVRSLAELASIL